MTYGTVRQSLESCSNKRSWYTGAYARLVLGQLQDPLLHPKLALSVIAFSPQRTLQLGISQRGWPCAFEEVFTPRLEKTAR